VDYGKLFDLEGKAAVVTGASSGIGRAIALGLAAAFVMLSSNRFGICI
jgi:NAD(P)-dependent dehydrogenase (short-subunit alcohol dehydrogenase family)